MQGRGEIGDKAREDIDFRMAFQWAPVAMVLTDLHGYILKANESFLGLFDLTQSQLEDQGLLSLVPSHEQESRRRLYLEWAAGPRKPLELEQRFLKASGTPFWGRVTLSAVLSAVGDLQYGVWVFHEVRMEDDDVQAQSQKRFNATLRALPDRLFITDPLGEILDFHCQADVEAKKEPVEIRGSPLTDLVPDSAVEPLLKGIESVLLRGGFVQFEYDQQEEDKERVYEVRIVASAREEALVIIRDVTEKRVNQRKLKDANAFLDTLLEHMPAMIFVKEAKDLRFVRWNKAGEEVIGHRRDTLVGKTDHDIFPKEQADFFVKADREALAAEGVVDIPEEPLKARNGDLRYLHTKKVAIRNERTGEPEYLLGISEDVTDRIRVKQALSRVREIHHRVKNNLQVVQSLLSLQSQGEEDPKFRAFLSTARSRVRAMSLIHEQLYQSSTVSRVDLAAYLRQLVPNLVQVYSLGPGPIEVTITGEMDLSLDVCVPCGLIIHELVSNSLKHAFPDGRRGRLDISLSSGPSGSFELSVEDDGIGLPSQFDFRKTHTLGLQLVMGLASQIRGRVTLEESPGCRFLLAFVD